MEKYKEVNLFIQFTKCRSEGSLNSLQSVLYPFSSVALLTKSFALTSFDYSMPSSQCFFDHPRNTPSAPLACPSEDPPH